MRGCVTKRRGKWAFVVELPKNPETGRRRQKWYSSFETKAAAEKELAKVLSELGQEEYVEATKETVGSFFTSWLEQKKASVRPGTYATYGWIVSCYLIPFIGNIRLDKLTPQHLVTLYHRLQHEKELSAQTVKHSHKVLHDGLQTAYKWGAVKRNVATLVKAPTVRKVEMKVWDENQLTSFLDAMKESRYYIIFLLAATTGMRRGEILGLRWQDISFAENKLSVRQSYVRGDRNFIFQEPKTAAGIRNIVLPKQTVDALRKHRLVQLQEKLAAGSDYMDHGLVVCTQIGRPMNPQQLDEAWRKALKKNDNLPCIRFHDLRHTQASLLLKAGVHPKVVSERLGHASTTITLDRYSHLLPGLQEAAAAKFNEIFAESKPVASAHKR